MFQIRTAKILACVMLGVACSLASVPGSTQSADKVAGIQWRCVQEQDEDFHIVCIPRPLRLNEGELPDPGLGADAAGSAADSELERPVGGVAAPHGRDLRPVALRGTKEVFSTSAWRLPLFRRPTNLLAVTRLLESVLCGGIPRCTVSYQAV